MYTGTKRKFALGLLVVGVVAFVGSVKYYDFDQRLTDMYSDEFGDKLDRTLKHVAGEDFTVCPRQFVAKGEQLGHSLCADGADAHEQPFYATFAMETADGVSYRGLLRKRDGTYTEYTWNPGRSIHSLFGAPEPTQVSCTDPHVLRHNWQGVPTCTDLR